MRRFILRLSNLFRGRHAERELDREIESHLGMLAEDFERRGLSPVEAKRAARLEYGGVEQTRELHREARSLVWAEQRLKDLRYGARSLLRNPTFTLAATITLALGIGANTAIFSVVRAVILRPLAYKDADRLVTILHDGSDPVAVANYIDWRDQSRLFAAMAAAESWSQTSPGAPLPSISADFASRKACCPCWALNLCWEGCSLPAKTKKDWSTRSS